MKGLPEDEKREVAADLLGVFDKYDLSVAVGLTRDGVAIRSQDGRVDATNLGEVSEQG